MLVCDTPAAPPPEVYRAPFRKWLFDRDFTIAEGARRLGMHPQVLRRNLLPHDDAGHKPASLATRRKVRALTAGEIGYDDWPEAPETPIGEPGSPPTGDRQSTSEGAPQILASALPSEAFSHT